ncbi:hypothetical protein [Sinomonas gamaensis]|uniref:hypothetical protein n=1 Tax=Sinomonas gamaensis TaxID=2565624 RepID=UPI001109BFDC|nr:hypothetical protein [Sinomonas gamaensis]
MTDRNAADETGSNDVERAEEQGGYGSPTPEEEMGPQAGQEAGGREGEGGSAGDEGIDPTDKDGMAGEPTD